MKSLILQVFDHIPNMNLGCVRFNYVQTRNDGYDVDMHLVLLKEFKANFSSSIQILARNQVCPSRLSYRFFFSDFECFIVDCMISCRNYVQLDKLVSNKVTDSSCFKPYLGVGIS